jgi:hypothetical protein
LTSLCTIKGFIAQQKRMSMRTPTITPPSAAIAGCLAGLLLCLASAASAADQTPQQLAELTATNYVQATVAFDGAALEKLLAPAYQEISPIGEVDSRSRVIGFYPATAKGNSPDVRAELSEWQSQTLQPGLVLSTAKLTYHFLKTSKTRDLRVQFVSAEQQGRWQLVSTQYTPIQPKKTK